MTTTVNVKAHCDPNTTEVQIKMTGAQGERFKYLRDGEEWEGVVYDDEAVTVREISAGNAQAPA